MNTEVSMKDPARHHFPELLEQFWLNFGPIWLPTSSQNASKAPQERSQRRFETLFGRSGGLLGRSLPPRLFGTMFKGFSMDLEVRTAKEEDIHNES